MVSPPFNSKNQTFLIAGPDGKHDIHISMAAIDAKRISNANICISWGVQLGLCLMMLLNLLLLLPVSKMKRPIHLVHILSLVVAVIRLTLLLQYFPGPLSEFYVLWTHDPRALKRSDYYINTTSQAFIVLQLALILLALIQQIWNLVTNWSNMWRYLVKALSITLAIATVVVRCIWVVHHTAAVRVRTIPIPLDNMGEAAVILFAVSVFYFCGIFLMNLLVHLGFTRGVIERTRGRLTSLEILAVGNGVLMVLPSMFAGLDIAAGISGTKVLPFDAGSWVQTLLVVGLPLVGLTARCRGPATQQASRKASHFANAPIPMLKATDPETTFGSLWASSAREEDGVSASHCEGEAPRMFGMGPGDQDRGRESEHNDRDNDPIARTGSSMSEHGVPRLGFQ